MRPGLLKHIVCPVCKKELQLFVFAQSNNCINEGSLRCVCGQTFPIIKGIPRLLPPALQLDLPPIYPDFYHRYKNLNNCSQVSSSVQIDNQTRATVNRFGYEWSKFSEYNCDNFLEFIAPLPSGFFENKLGLDAGCGAGRHAGRASLLGAEMIAIDISPAVDSAYQNNLNNDSVHIIQTDIYHLPFRTELFDFIYSLGVLHHLSNPENGYRTLIPHLKTHGAIFIWLYAHSIRKVALEALRLMAKRLSNENIQRMAIACNLIDYGIFVNLYRIMAKLPVAGKIAKKRFPLRLNEYANHGYRVALTDWFDRLSAPITNYYKTTEMQNWLNRSGLINTRLAMEGDSWWWLYGERL
jgi:SAM-dependent methyltransferase/uncharacterized protein YbaR (Trm112 family)